MFTIYMYILIFVTWSNFQVMSVGKLESELLGEIDFPFTTSGLCVHTVAKVVYRIIQCSRTAAVHV